jgi:hypothetical protein
VRRSQLIGTGCPVVQICRPAQIAGLYRRARYLFNHFGDLFGQAQCLISRQRPTLGQLVQVDLDGGQGLMEL